MQVVTCGGGAVGGTCRGKFSVTRLSAALRFNRREGNAKNSQGSVPKASSF